VDVVLRASSVLLNTAQVERSRHGYLLYDEGMTTGVAHVVEALDVERLALGNALGVEILPIAEALTATGLGPDGDVWTAVNGSFPLSEVSVRATDRALWHAEDVSFGLRTWIELGQQLAVTLPVMRAVVALCDLSLGADSWNDGRSLADLGIDEMDAATLEYYLQFGGEA